MKLLLYCTKAKPYLLHMPKDNEEFKKGIEFSLTDGKEFAQACIDVNNYKLNGKIVAECDFEAEEIEVGEGGNKLVTKTLSEYNLLMKSCLDLKDILKYTENIDGFGYAIHIKNLQIFDKPRELYDCLIHPKIEPKFYGCEHLSKAPQNMMYVELDDIKYILISIRPEWLCKILNKEKTIEVRKKVLKEMLK